MTRRAFKFVTIVVAAVSLGVFATGCQAECVDKFDCKSIQSRPENVKLGKQFTCVEAKCVECAKDGCPGTLIPDAGP